MPEATGQLKKLQQVFLFRFKFGYELVLIFIIESAALDRVINWKQKILAANGDERHPGELTNPPKYIYMYYYEFFTIIPQFLSAC